MICGRCGPDGAPPPPSEFAKTLKANGGAFGPDGKLTPMARTISPGHSSLVKTVTITEEGEVDLDLFNMWVAKFLNENGQRVYRFKGILAAHGEPKKLVLQAVHMVFTGEKGSAWQPDEKRVCSIVLIGLNLDSDELRADLKSCFVGRSSYRGKLERLKRNAGKSTGVGSTNEGKPARKRASASARQRNKDR
eukprot:FR736352.1.p1 GENE.FR736352.1~~FR736352.1.p1  ORF type:complete len:192 (+),score=17.81 FR736352.1:79-654(+)